MARYLGIGESFPSFEVPACVALEKGKEFANLTLEHLKGKWSVVFFWPLDFTTVCPTEIVAFDREYAAFRERGAEVYGGSCDSQYVHLAWRQNHAGLKALQFPMLADHKKELCEALGILHPVEKVPLRATYLLDPDGVIRWLSVYDLSVGRNVKEVLRALDALRTDQLTPCDWQPGQATLQS